MKTLATTIYLLTVAAYSLCSAQDFNTVRHVTVPAGKSLVYVYSKDKKSYPVFFDGRNIGAIAKNKFIYAILDAGSYTFTATPKIPALKIDVEPDQVYYIVQRERNAPFMIATDPVEAEKDLATYKVSAAINTSYAESSGNSDAYRKGFLDAETFYTKTSGAMAGNMVATALTSPIVGLIPAAITSGAKPADKNLGVPDASKMTDEDYMKGYRESASKKKKKATWSGYATGASIWALLLVVLL